jgi:cytochrome oxidase Cu insertion factor (SCO1/SenC/PrrC family)
VDNSVIPAGTGTANPRLVGRPGQARAGLSRFNDNAAAVSFRYNFRTPSTGTKALPMNRATVFMIAALSILLLAGLGVLGYQRFPVVSDPQTQAGGALQPRIGGPFALVDGAGNAVTDQDFRGKFMLIYFGYTHCPDACPTALNDMAQALDKLGERRGRVAPIFITVDPERDTGPVIADYVAAFGPDFVGLTGTPEQLAQAKKAFHVYAAKHPTSDGDYDMDHTSIIYMMDPSGHFIGNFTHESDPDAITRKLAAALS